MAAMLIATIIWLASLVMLPAPTSPTRVTVEAMVLSRSSYLAKTSSLPPTMTAMVPSMALGSPPETGASRNSTPISSRRFAKSRLASGAMELMSMTHLPEVRPSTMPFSLKRAASTCGELGSMVITTSAFSATSLPLAQATPPSATSSSARSMLKSNA